MHHKARTTKEIRAHARVREGKIWCTYGSGRVNGGEEALLKAISGKLAWLHALLKSIVWQVAYLVLAWSIGIWLLFIFGADCQQV